MEDTFYILKNCVSRVLSTSSVFATCFVLESFSQILDTEFIGVFQKKLSISFSSNDIKESRSSVIVRYFHSVIHIVIVISSQDHVEQYRGQL